MAVIICNKHAHAQAGVHVGKSFTFIEIVPHAEYEVWLHGICDCCHEGSNCRLVLPTITAPVTDLHCVLLSSDAVLAAATSGTNILWKSCTLSRTRDSQDQLLARCIVRLACTLLRD